MRKCKRTCNSCVFLVRTAHRLATGNVTSVVAVGEGLAEEVVDPLKEVLEGESLGEGLGGLAVSLVAGAGLGRDRSVDNRAGERAGNGRDVGSGSRGGGGGVAGGRVVRGRVVLLVVVLRVVLVVVGGLDGSRGLGGGGGGRASGAGQGDGGGAGSGGSLLRAGESGLSGGLRGRSLRGDRGGAVAASGRSVASGDRGGGRGSRGGSATGGRATVGAGRSTARVEGRAGDLVVGKTRVDAEGDTSVGGAVELSGGDASGLGGAGTSDLNVDALGVVLGAVGVLGRVEGDDLVTENVLTRGDILGNCEFVRMILLSVSDLIIVPVTVQALPSAIRSSEAQFWEAASLRPGERVATLLRKAEESLSLRLRRKMSWQS